MKKIAVIILAALMASSVMALMDDQPIVLTTTSTNQNSASMVFRGTLEAVYLDVTANTTNTFTITDEFGQTLFSKSVTADAIYYPSMKRQTYAGADFGDLIGATFTNMYYDKFPMAGKVTVKLVPPAGAATSSVSHTATIIYSK